MSPFGVKTSPERARYIRIEYWPAGERVRPKPDRLQALKPEKWGRMSGQAREAWARNQLRRQAMSKVEYVGWVNSDA
jgi:hypothetical protein